MDHEKELKRIVRSVLESRFEDIDIVSINITPDFDEDGDKIIIVKVVFDSDMKKLDARETSGLLRRILPQIEDIGETGFPILSFIAKSELGKMSPESA